MRWGDATPRTTVNPRHLVTDLLWGLNWPMQVGAAWDPETTNEQTPGKLPFVGVAIDGKGGNDVRAAWLVRLQVWGDNPTPVDTLTMRLEAVLTQGGVPLPDTVDDIQPVAWYPATTDSRTGLMVGSVTVRVLAKYSAPVT